MTKKLLALTSDSTTDNEESVKSPDESVANNEKSEENPDDSKTVVSEACVCFC